MAKRERVSNLDPLSQTNKKAKKILEEEEVQSKERLDLERISLRPFKCSDIKDFMSWASDPEIYRFVVDEPPPSKKDGLVLVKARICHRWFKSICLDDKSIGDISVSSLNVSEGNTRRAEIKFRVRSSFWRMGIASRAVNLALKEVFFDWQFLDRVEAIVDVENVASQRVLEKNGFVREGVLRKYFVLNGNPRDVIMYSLLSSEFLDLLFSGRD